MHCAVLPEAVLKLETLLKRGGDSRVLSTSTSRYENSISRDSSAPRDQGTPRDRQAPRDQRTPRDREAPRDQSTPRDSEAPLDSQAPDRGFDKTLEDSLLKSDDPEAKNVSNNLFLIDCPKNLYFNMIHFLRKPPFFAMPY